MAEKRTDAEKIKLLETTGEVLIDCVFKILRAKMELQSPQVHHAVVVESVSKMAEDAGRKEELESLVKDATKGKSKLKQNDQEALKLKNVESGQTSVHWIEPEAVLIPNHSVKKMIEKWRQGEVEFAVPETSPSSSEDWVIVPNK
ncbi:hypothetical protein ACS0TY_009273 [Phlomoides rotata]